MEENKKEIIKEKNKINKEKEKKKKASAKQKLDRATILGIIAVCIASVGLVIAILALVLGGGKSGKNSSGLEFYPDGNGNYIVGAGEAKYLSEITIPEKHNGGNVIGIDNEGFAYCENLKSITIPDSVTNIGDYAFAYCDKLTDINMGSGVTNIGLYAFSGCTALASINLSENLQTIDEYAFYACENLVNISIPDSVISVGANAFTNCDSLNFTISENGYYLGNRDNPYHTLVKIESTEITSFTVNEGTRVIYSGVFDFCYKLTEIDLPEGVTQIGVEAFYNCESLKTLIIPRTLKYIGDRAFSGCTSLSAIYYTGEENQIYSITVEYDNDPFFEAEFYYNYTRSN